mmetsp:Transcript_50723/g.58157  ORF Transcript_50723/g.58157 Transcript_50723/m.58157 type:complete len:187 (-) Transcript_50723:326-886(-)
MVRSDPSLSMKISQYVVAGRRKVSEEDPNPEVFKMRVFAPNDVLAKTKFWYFVRKLNKIKRAAGEIISVNQIFEKNIRHVKTYGILLRYESRTGIHNMYKEYRDTSLDGAVGRMFMEMSGRHRARPDTIHIIRTDVLKKADDVKRPASNAFRDDQIKFPLLNKSVRTASKRHRGVFKARRPALFRG